MTRDWGWGRCRYLLWGADKLTFWQGSNFIMYSCHDFGLGGQVLTAPLFMS